MGTIADIIRDILYDRSDKKTLDGKKKPKYHIQPKHGFALIAVLVVIFTYRYFESRGKDGAFKPDASSGSSHSSKYKAVNSAWMLLRNNYRSSDPTYDDKVRAALNDISTEEEKSFSSGEEQEVSLARDYIQGIDNGTVAGWAKIAAVHSDDELKPIAQFKEKSNTAKVNNRSIAKYFGAKDNDYEEGVLSVDPAEFNDKLQIALTKLGERNKIDPSGWGNFEGFARALAKACSFIKESDVPYIDKITQAHASENHTVLDNIEASHVTTDMCFSRRITRNSRDYYINKNGFEWDFFRIYIQVGNRNYMGGPVQDRKDPDIARIEITYSIKEELIIVADIIP